MANFEEDRLLKVNKVATRLRLSRSAVYNLIKRGALTYVDVASGERCSPRVKESELRRFVDERTHRKGER